MKEKLEEARVIYATASDETKRALESLFPELKENEDERIRKAIIALVKKHAVNHERCQMEAYLGKQKEHQSVEWSEEDEKLLDLWLDIIDRNDWRMDENFCQASREFVNRLKSLRPQPHWKPSKEQMEALYTVLEHEAERIGPSKPLELANSLYDDLKKYFNL